MLGAPSAVIREYGFGPLMVSLSNRGCTVRPSTGSEGTIGDVFGVKPRHPGSSILDGYAVSGSQPHGRGPQPAWKTSPFLTVRTGTTALSTLRELPTTS